MAIKSGKHKSQTKSKDILSLLLKNKLILFVLIFAAVASAILIISHAAGPTVSLEAESGTVTGPATKCGTDSTASNNDCVQFKKTGSATTYTITDPQCTAAQIAATGVNADGVSNSCTMTFQETALDKNPVNGTAFNDPRPGLLAANSSGDAGLTDIANMGSTNGVGGCVISGSSYYNCKPPAYGQSTDVWATSPTTNPNDNQTWYYNNCIAHNSLVASHAGNNGNNVPIPGWSLYVTNCHIYVNGDGGGYGNIGYGVDSTHGTQIIHSLIDCSGSSATTLNHPVVFNNGNKNAVYYSKFQDCSDNITDVSQEDVEWNYFHLGRVVNCAAIGGCHDDPNEEYGGTTGPHIIAHNYYQGNWDSSTGPANIAPYGGGSTSHIFIYDNKALAATGGYANPQSIIVDDGQNPNSTVTDVQITNNLFYPSASVPADLGNTGHSNEKVCNAAIPNACITVLSGNKQISATGTITTWQ